MNIILYTTIFLIGVLIGIGICVRINEKASRKKIVIYGLFTGVLFVILAISLGLNSKTAASNTSIYFLFGILYVLALILISRNDLQKHNIKKTIMLFLFIIVSFYLIFRYYTESESIDPTNIFYLVLIAMFLILDTFIEKAYGKSNYTLNVLVLSFIMVISTNEGIYLLTVVYTLLIVAIRQIVNIIKRILKKHVKSDKQTTKKIPIGFFMSIAHVIIFILANYIRTQWLIDFILTWR